MSLDDLQAQLRGTLDQQFAALTQKYEEDLAEARQQAAAEAERDAAVKVEQARAELEAAHAESEARIQTVAAAVRADAEQQVAAAAAARAEAEQRAAESTAARAEFEQQLAASAAVRAEFEQRLAAAAAARTELERQLAASTAAHAEADQRAVLERMLAATREIDGARSLSQALESLLTHAGAAAGRAAIFLINGDRLKAWKTAGIPEIDVQTVESSIGGRDLLARAIQGGQATPSSAELPAPPFARLPPDRAGLAAPLMIGGRAVAVLYADSGSNPVPAGAVETIEALVCHTSAIVALRTAMRTLDVLGGTPDEAAGGGEVSDDQGARRYARLLVSEIKLYNEAAVRDGRQKRDIMQRLRAEIDRAQRLYEERVPPAVGGRHVYFQQELVQTLADGDPALLGSP